MKLRLARPVLLWLLGLALCATLALRAHYSADMSAFLPRNPTPAQQLLVEQLTEGVLSRLLLVGIEGGTPSERADLSRALARRLEDGGLFISVRNGDAAVLARDREILFSNRYLLSPAVSPERFSSTGLRTAVEASIDLLASPAGMMLKGLLGHDPTGEMMEMIGTLDTGGSPASQHGAWASRDGRRAILMLQTRAAGSDTDAQAAAIARIHADFAELPKASPDTRLLLSGAAVFAVNSRAAIESEAVRLTTISTAAVICLLLLIYRSVTAVILGLLPVATGALAGIAAVALGFGSVHGLTIGFGTTLIGEAVDYTIYYFVQSDGEDGEGRWMERFWPTIRLGVLTSVFGFASLLFSGFPGLAQLGLYSIAGLVTAAAVTRFVLPHLRPTSFHIRDIAPLGRAMAGFWGQLSRLRLAIPLLAIAASVVLVTHRDQIWSSGLSGLSPVSSADQALDQSLRADLGAPDLRYLVVLKAANREAALLAAEQAGMRLTTLVEAGALGGFESPARFLPSEATQRARQQSLPARDELARRLNTALDGLPLRADKLGAFLDDVDAARRQPLLTPESLRGSTLALAVDSLLLERPQGWTVLMPLRAPAGDTPLDPARIQAALAGSGALFVDIFGESNHLYQAYLDEAILLSLAGCLAIVLLMAVTLRQPGRLIRVLIPLVATELIVMAGLALTGQRLTLLHLIGMLLIVAVGSNYALFFDRADSNPGDDPRTLASLLLANLATVIGFGALAFSPVPVLKAIGITVGPGAVLTLMISAMLARKNKH
ncbi:MAG: MMPL family transporter [Zoogloea oleivorans]|jgi:predicted exporter|uniref:MMPL family transporter n=1 Tax=Zoogloea oleivorans TaxID=1552750 RepID=UPI002A361D94|nr:MMPL family transporter [Zoogloea oleivorans]MDY0037138.1 MMPL family transporter [Zoogloea oleivorans]